MENTGGKDQRDSVDEEAGLFAPSTSEGVHSEEGRPGVFIPKKDGQKTRPLGIHVMKDRAMQALHLLALEPIAETTGDPNSYGFKPERSTADAGEQCFIVLANASRAQWVFEADIKGCYDNRD